MKIFCLKNFCRKSHGTNFFHANNFNTEFYNTIIAKVQKDTPISARGQSNKKLQGVVKSGMYLRLPCMQRDMGRSHQGSK